MQSSIAILLRAGVLLGCLAALPLMAAGGVGGFDKFLAEAQGWWQRHQQSSPLNAPRTIQVELPAEALQYRDFAPFDEELEVTEASHLPGESDVMDGASLDSRHSDHAEFPSWPRGANSSAPADIRLVSNSQNSDVVETFFENPAAGASDTVDRPFPSQGISNRLSVSQIGEQLRQLGAIDVKLEPWGTSGQFHRYQVLMAMGGAGDVERHFQAIHSSPDLAAQDVLQQVQTWRNR